MGNKKGKCLYLDVNYTLALSACGIDNLSEFVNFVMEETILLDQPDFSPRKQAKIVADSVRKKIQGQRKLIEDQETYQKQAERMRDKFDSEASKMFRNIRSFSSKLPEHDIHCEHVSIWNKCATTLSESCGCTVTPTECIAYVRKKAGGSS